MLTSLTRLAAVPLAKDGTHPQLGHIHPYTLIRASSRRSIEGISYLSRFTSGGSYTATQAQPLAEQ